MKVEGLGDGKAVRLYPGGGINQQRRGDVRRPAEEAPVQRLRIGDQERDLAGDRPPTPQEQHPPSETVTR
jgi:hypothetical protein